VQAISKYKRVVFIAILTILFAISIYIYSSIALDLYKLEVMRGGGGYVTDEVWYVSASRVILVKVFKLEPKQPISVYNATVVFKVKPSTQQLLSLARELNLTINTELRNLSAIYVSGERNSVQLFIRSLSDSVVDVIPGWILPDKQDINNFINWEHPPLAKYLIGLIMYYIGDYPAYWRIPVILTGALTVVLVFLIVHKITGSILASLITSILVLVDPMSRALFSIALLDGYVALFTTIALYLTIQRRYREALLTTLIGGCFKASALFTTIPLIILVAREDAVSRGRSVLVFIKSLVKYTALSAILYTSLLVIVSIPVMNYMGITQWFNYALIGAVKWHASTKCVGAGCPISSAPWDWFIGLNSFPLYIYPDGSVLYASGFYPLWSLSLILLILFTPLLYTRERVYGYIVLLFLGTLLGYIGLWIIGGRSQYSFYAVHFTPLVYINLAFIFTKILPREELVREALGEWIRVISGIISKIFLT
jgi:predicted membrane-bound dolichyl-phosphate-mannose-protein mannosyltransferase